MDGSLSKHGMQVEDRISELPDELLYRILSFVPIKSAVRTGVLSKRWKNLWTCAGGLDIDNNDFSQSQRKRLVGMVVDYVLAARGSSCDILKLRICVYFHFNEEFFSGFDRWICTAVQRNVVELDLCAWNPWYYLAWEVPESVFTCKTLTVLKVRLDFPISFDPPTSVTCCFPSLKVLHVETYMCNFGDASNEKLFSSFPVLEELTMAGRFAKDVVNFNIPAPKLKTFMWATRGGSRWGVTCSRKTPCHVSIMISSLELEILRVDVNCNDVPNFVVQNSKSLLKSRVIWHCCEAHPREAYPKHDVDALVEKVPNIKYLSITNPSFDDDCVGSQLPPLQILKQLELKLRPELLLSEIFMEFLQSTPNLEHLVLVLRDPFEEPIRAIKHFSPATLAVPTCLFSHLKTISIQGFGGEDEVMEVAEYLSKFGLVLKKITISTSGSFLSKREEITKRISMFHCGSDTCHVELTGYQTEEDFSSNRMSSRIIKLRSINDKEAFVAHGRHEQCCPQTLMSRNGMNKKNRSIHQRRRLRKSGFTNSRDT